MAVTERRRKLMSSARWWMLVLGLLANRTLIYDCGDCLEIEERDHFSISRRRMYFHDIAMVSFHRYRRVGAIVLSLIIAAFFGLIALAVMSDHNGAGPGMVLLCMFSLPFGFFGLFLWVVGSSCVRLHGLRSSGEVRFGFAHGHARQMYRRLGRRIGDEQAKMRAGSQPAVPEAAPGLADNDVAQPESESSLAVNAVAQPESEPTA